MPSRLDPIVSGASVRSRKRARSPSSTSANRIAGQRDAGRAQLPQDQDALRFGQAPAPVVVEIGRRRPAFVDQPVGRRAAKIQVQQQPVRAGRGGARLGEVARRDEHEVVAQETGEAIEVLAAVLAHDEAG